MIVHLGLTGYCRSHQPGWRGSVKDVLSGKAVISSTTGHKIERQFSRFNIHAFRVGLGASEGRGPAPFVLDDDDEKSLSPLENPAAG